jgi:hypothetical protein
LAQALNRGSFPGRNLLRHVFLDPEDREYYVDLEEVGEVAVAGLRASAGAEPDDPRLTGLSWWAPGVFTAVMDYADFTDALAADTAPAAV